jgi:hypothetical protein
VVLSFFIFYCVNSSAQKLSDFNIIGKWKIKNWYFFEKLNETKGEHAERIRQYHNCLKGYAQIDSNELRLSSNDCQLYPCNKPFLMDGHTELKRIVPDNKYTLMEKGSEMIDSNIVGRKFVDLLDKKYSKKYLMLLNTECKQSYGNYTVKICLINKNIIGIFFGEELMVLQRRR